MTEVIIYIQPLALCSLLQNPEEIPGFPVSLIMHKGFGRKVIWNAYRKVSVIDGFKNRKTRKGGYAA
jgi:hypothetical protein